MSDIADPKGGGAKRRPLSFQLRRWGMVAVGLLGVVILIGLCLWQLQRLEWKEGLIAVLEQRLASDPIQLPEVFDPEGQEFYRVTVTGRFIEETGGHGFVDAPLLTSRKFVGPGYRVIQPFETTTGRRIMIDRGFLPVAEKNERGAAARPTPSPAGPLKITGALRWPRESGDAFGPSDNVWTLRDLDQMAALFGVERVLVIAETSTAVGDWPEPEPLEAVKIRNNHLEYAITWASLAIVWAIMTGWLAFRPQKAPS